jgi:hypothetical protein
MSLGSAPAIIGAPVQSESAPSRKGNSMQWVAPKGALGKQQLGCGL